MVTPESIVALIMSTFVIGLLLYLSIQSRAFRKGILVIALGMFIGTWLHSVAYLLYFMGLIGHEFLMSIMPLLVITGSLLIVLGIIWIAVPFSSLVRIIQIIDNGNIDTKIDSKLKRKDDEIGMFARSYDKMMKNMKLAAEQLTYCRAMTVGMKTSKVRAKGKR